MPTIKIMLMSIYKPNLAACFFVIVSDTIKTTIEREINENLIGLKVWQNIFDRIESTLDDIFVSNRVLHKLGLKVISLEHGYGQDEYQHDVFIAMAVKKNKSLDTSICSFKVQVITGRVSLELVEHYDQF